MPETIGGYKHPVRNINREILDRLSLEDNKVYPLKGGTMPRANMPVDPRLSQLTPTAGLPGLSDEIVMYEHVATIRYRAPGDNRRNDQFYVAFRETMDCLFLQQRDVELYPEWLMKDKVKRTELRTFIYLVKCHWKQVPVLRNHEDWLTHVADPSTMDTLAYFLLKNNIISQEMYGKM